MLRLTLGSKMTQQITFDVTYVYEDSSEGISLPVTITYGNNQFRSYAKVDTGAEFCIFSFEIGENLGIDVPSGIPKTMGSLTAHWIHLVTK